MTIAFYLVAGLAALIFLIVGTMKLLRPKSALAASGLTWVEDFKPTSIKLIGLVEILGAIGLIVPAATGIARILSPIAGICLAIVMIAAAFVHVRRKENPSLPFGLTVLTGAAAVLGFLAFVTGPDDTVANNLAGMDRLDYEGWNNADWDGVFAHLHTADVTVHVNGYEPTHGLPNHITAMKEWISHTNNEPPQVISHPIQFGSGEWTTTVGETADGTRIVTIARWRDGAIAEEYIWT